MPYAPPMGPLGLPGGLIAGWALNEGAGRTVFDITGRGTNGVLTSMDPASDWVMGQNNAALDFDGDDDFVEIANVSKLVNASAMTVEAIALWDRANAWQSVLGSWDNSAANARCYSLGSSVLHSNHFMFAVSPDGTYPSSVVADSGVVPTTGKWYHLVGTYDGSYLRIYIDGVLTGAPQAYSGDIYTGITQCRFAAINGGTNWHDGKIARGCLWSRALSAGEITSLYANPDAAIYGLQKPWWFRVAGGGAHYEHTSGGDLAIDGAASAALAAVVAAGGDLVVDGASGVVLGAVVSSGGDLVVDGAAGAILSAQITSGGALALDGAAGAVLSAVVSSGGGLVIDGAGQARVVAVVTSGGDLIVDGGALAGYRYTVVSGGDLVVDGGASLVGAYVVLDGGDLAVDGSAEAVLAYVVLAGGDVVIDGGLVIPDLTFHYLRLLQSGRYIGGL